MSAYHLLIDGKMVPGDLTMPVLNPATEEVLAGCPHASKTRQGGRRREGRLALSGNREHWPVIRKC
jgi:hypothetical protein